MSRRNRNTWRQAAKAAAFSYPELRRELDALQAGTGRDLDGLPGSLDARRSTEDAALSQQTESPAGNGHRNPGGLI